MTCLLNSASPEVVALWMNLEVGDTVSDFSQPGVCGSVDELGNCTGPTAQVQGCRNQLPHRYSASSQVPGLLLQLGQPGEVTFDVGIHPLLCIHPPL